eukprot:Sspe_Gene.75553::Locus_47197_Transcript_1_1_Confidence_1.000_Length_886::g.75553::m.75553
MLRGRLAIVTGATSGIGEAAARFFVKEGATIAAVGRNRVKLQQLEKDLKCSVIESDIAKDGECQKVVEEAAKRLGGLTTLVNCAGVLHGAPFGTPGCNLENLMVNFNINTKAVFEMMHFAVPHLISAGKGSNPSIVNVTSVNGIQSFGGTASYCTSKAATEMLTKCAALDLSQHNIRVNAVSPGVVITELQKRGGLSEEQYEKFLERCLVTHPLFAGTEGRITTPEQVAELIAFLSSDKALFITGESVRIDGGRGVLGAR